MRNADAKRVPLTRDILMDYDPYSELEPRWGAGAYDAQVSPYVYRGAIGDWPEMPDRQMYPQDEAPSPSRARALARLMMGGQ